LKAAKLLLSILVLLELIMKLFDKKVWIFINQYASYGIRLRISLAGR